MSWPVCAIKTILQINCLHNGHVVSACCRKFTEMYNAENIRVLTKEKAWLINILRGTRNLSFVLRTFASKCSYVDITLRLCTYFYFMQELIIKRIKTTCRHDNYFA